MFNPNLIRYIREPDRVRKVVAFMLQTAEFEHQLMRFPSPSFGSSEPFGIRTLQESKHIALSTSYASIGKKLRIAGGIPYELEHPADGRFVQVSLTGWRGLATDLPGKHVWEFGNRSDQAIPIDGNFLQQVHDALRVPE
ncbi:MAG TPA: hypothetical protein VF575_01240 [Candidatus Saccharimonadales bacterium]|jgi:hypothetical protein